MKTKFPLQQLHSYSVPFILFPPEFDLLRLSDHTPATLDKTLQHKCYAALTGDDLALFPDLTTVPPADVGSVWRSRQQRRGSQDDDDANSRGSLDERVRLIILLFIVWY